jgi:hypothetical protein
LWGKLRDGRPPAQAFCDSKQWPVANRPQDAILPHSLGKIMGDP